MTEFYIYKSLQTKLLFSNVKDAFKNMFSPFSEEQTIELCLVKLQREALILFS